MAAFEVRSVLAIKAELGEAAMWSVEEQALFWVDILKATFNRFDPISGSNQVLALPAKPGCFALRDGGAVIATAKGYYDLDFRSGALAFLLDAPFGEKAGHVLRFTPDGALDLKIEMPVLVPTMVAFGGRDLSTLYVTSGSIEHQLERKSSDLSGNLFAIETPFRGIPEAKYNS
jgi:sugar lactone lactonase YvrE